MRGIATALLQAWTTASKTDERGYLRALHSKANLTALAQEMNRLTLPARRAVTLSSLWVDWQPQCWKWNVAKANFSKPSVELADLIVVVWDDNTQQVGTALVLAAKMADTATSFSLHGRSTKKEIAFLESPYRFLISRDMKGAARALPGFTVKECEFDFSVQNVGRPGFNFWRWLLIRKKMTTRWRAKRTAFSVKEAAALSVRNSFERILAEMTLGRRSKGRFWAGCMRCEWCRLINLLIGYSRAVPHHPKAHGPACVDSFLRAARPVANEDEANCAFVELDIQTCLPPESADSTDSQVPQFHAGDGGNIDRYLRFDSFFDLPHPQCSIIFVTPHDVDGFRSDTSK